MIFWTAATWILTIILIHFFGFNGFAIGLLILSLTLIVVVKLVRRFATFSFFEYTKWPIIAGLVQTVWYLIARGGAPYTYVRLGIVGVIGVFLYAGIIWLTERKRIFKTIHLSRE